MVLRVPSLLATKKNRRCWHDTGDFFPWEPPLEAATIDGATGRLVQKSRVGYPDFHYWLSPALRHALRAIPPRDLPPLRPNVALFIARFLESGHVADRTVARDLLATDIDDFKANDLVRRRAWWPTAALGLYITGGAWNETERDVISAFALLYGFAVVWADEDRAEIEECATRFDDGDLSIFDKTRCKGERRPPPAARGIAWAWHTLKGLFSRGTGDAQPQVHTQLHVTLDFPV